LVLCQGLEDKVWLFGELWDYSFGVGHGVANVEERFDRRVK
jgi:hypothetical protein